MYLLQAAATNNYLTKLHSNWTNSACVLREKVWIPYYTFGIWALREYLLCNFVCIALLKVHSEYVSKQQVEFSIVLYSLIRAITFLSILTQHVTWETRCILKMFTLQAAEVLSLCWVGLLFWATLLSCSTAATTRQEKYHTRCMHVSAAAAHCSIISL